MTRTALLLAVAAAMGLAGCGDDDPGAGGPGTTAPAATSGPAEPTAGGATATTAAPAARPSPADLELATEGLLRLPDLGPGWTGGAPRRDPEPADAGPCESIRAAKRTASARATAAAFERRGQKVENAVYVYPDEAGAREQLEALAGEGTARCLAGVLVQDVRRAAAARPGAKVEEPVIRPVAAATAGADSRAARIAIVATRGARRDDIAVTLQYTRVGRALTLLSLVGVDDAGRGRVAAGAVRRLADAQSVGP